MSSRKISPQSVVSPSVSPAPAIATSDSPRNKNAKDAATYLGCTVFAIRHAYWTHKLPGFFIGRRLLFDVRDLDAFNNEMQQKAGAA